MRPDIRVDAARAHEEAINEALEAMPANVSRSIGRGGGNNSRSKKRGRKSIHRKSMHRRKKSIHKKRK